MLMALITPPRRQDYLVVRMMRRWAAEREQGGAQLPSVVQLGQSLGIEAQAAVAVASMFQLTEHCLGRSLQAECCCSLLLSNDETAILRMLGAAEASSLFTATSIPHGLPGALLWAVESVRRLLGVGCLPSRAAQSRCPFSLSPEH